MPSKRIATQFLARCTLEAGKTLADGVAEVREAVDFLRYYASQARSEFGGEKVLVGPTGERNSLRLRGRGVFACISPWNFPLAIFTGQVGAALAAGNAVIAKPAEQTPLTAALAVQLLHASGVPTEVLQFLPGDGGTVGAALTRDPRIAGVAFTGSTDTARLIERSLAARNGSIATLIAETGGLQRDDRRQLRAGRAGRARRRRVRLQQCWPALLGASRAAASRAISRRGCSSCSPAIWKSCASAIQRCSRPTWAR